MSWKCLGYSYRTPLTRTRLSRSQFATEIRHPLHPPSRTLSNVSSRQVRRHFLDFFAASHHQLISSSPVVPFNDPSLTFVNAGMNQFKPVFQGVAPAPGPRVANSQKCIRVGGKHNDLDAVGQDGHHHTFFEMLGSWSFGDYWKKDACSMAWNLLTQVYGLNPDRLYVTYFEGSDVVEADAEVYEVWRSLGVGKDRILPFGAKDNFWEMGLSGPCGPCTEIHFDHGGVGAAGVNAGTSENVEIWNIVFMEYERSLVGDLRRLPTRHIDTGMGLERLTAVLNNSTSNYDTDLFVPLFETIQKMSGAPAYAGSYGHQDHLDVAYRVLADHARMITVCLADGVFPDHNPKLKNVLKRAQAVATDSFKCESGLLKELAFKVTDILGETHQELYQNIDKVKTILEFEEENARKMFSKGLKFKTKLASEFPKEASQISTNEAVNFYEGLKCMQKENIDEVSIGDKLAYKLYESHGLSISDISKVASLTNLSFDSEAFEKYFEEMKTQSKIKTAQIVNMRNIVVLCDGIAPTLDSDKYIYEKVEDGGEEVKYKIPTSKAEVRRIVSDGQKISSMKEGQTGILIVDKTNFYFESGGQVGDIGLIKSESGLFSVEDTQQVGGQWVAHFGKVEQGEIVMGEGVEMEVDEHHRLSCMQNHTGAHLLNSVLNSVLQITCQKSSFVGPKYFRFDFAVFGCEFGLELVDLVESRVVELIAGKSSISRRIVSSEELVKMNNVIRLPGEVYPSQVSLIEVNEGFEPCCGTHVVNCGDVESFAIVQMRTPTTGVRSVKCLTGKPAIAARKRGIELCGEILKFQEVIERACDEIDAGRLEEIYEKIDLWKGHFHNEDIPLTVSTEMLTVLDKYSQKLKISHRAVQKTSVEAEIKEELIKLKDLQYFVHFIRLSDSKVSLSKVAKMVKNKPVLVFSGSGGEVKATALVPKQCVKENFTAEKWLTEATQLLNAKGSAPRGKDPKEHFNMKVVRIEEKDFDSIMDDVIAVVNEFAKNYI